MSFLDRFTNKKTAGKSARSVAPKAEKKEEAGAATMKASEGTMKVPTGKGGNLAYRVLIKPLITEKTAVMQGINQYTFVVAKWASKVNIKQVIKEMYGVTPVSVNVLHTQGRNVRSGKGAGSRSDYKKAIVTLPAGKSITIHEGV